VCNKARAGRHVAADWSCNCAEALSRNGELDVLLKSIGLQNRHAAVYGFQHFEVAINLNQQLQIEVTAASGVITQVAA
jgi:hypothetical protein